MKQNKNGCNQSQTEDVEATNANDCFWILITENICNFYSQNICGAVFD